MRTRTSRSQGAEPFGDRMFAGISRFSGITIVLLLAAVTGFLVIRSVPAFSATPESASLLSGNFLEYAAPLLFGTLWIAALSLLIALPLAVAIALFTVFYAPRGLSRPLGYLIDLLSAVPSVVFGLWGITVFAPAVQPFYTWLNHHLGWFPLFAGDVSGTGRTALTAALVLAVMILPVITAVCREIFRTTPVLSTEAASALGATRWEMIRIAVLPIARSGILSAAMLGLGRALGETMAIAMVLSATGTVSFALLTAENPSTIAANIALMFPEAFGENINVLIATGCVLFATTFLVNAVARAFITRSTQKGTR